MNHFKFVQFSAALVLGAVMAGCSGTGDQFSEGEVTEVVQELPSGCTQLDQSVITHVCTHPTSGPFQTINGTLNPPTAITADHYYVTLDFTTDMVSPFEGSARYTASATDEYAIHYKPSSGTTITVRDATNAVVSSVLSGTNSTCSGDLQAYKVYPLSSAGSKNPYKITFSRTATPKSANLVVERLTPQSRFWYVDADSDTWGDSSTQKVTFCTPPATHTVNRGLDCNDSNASVYPGSGC